ncbi:hypothetical protein LCGC14_2022900 [marine sediment metagenome]|uniref:Uncharacterized protein n=1 Tax=marine sediment metagenome TaxID=412755 RepID=A0A0F9HU22_9ZZZZ
MKKVNEIQYRWDRSNLSLLNQQFERDLKFLLSIVKEMEEGLEFYRDADEDDGGKMAKKLLKKLNKS